MLTRIVVERWSGIVLFGLGMLGCASTGKALSQDGAREMAGLSIRPFLKTRFVDAVHILPVDKEKFVRADGSVILEALYTDVNMAQLHRPSTELVRFCHAQDGKVTRTDVDRAAERAAVEAQRNKADEERFCADVAASGQATLMDCRFAMARARAYEAIPMPRFTAAEAAQAGSPGEDFGRFSCKHLAGSRHHDWDVVIEAIDFEPGESGTLKANSLTLLISPSTDSI